MIERLWTVVTLHVTIFNSVSFYIRGFIYQEDVLEPAGYVGDSHRSSLFRRLRCIITITTKFSFTHTNGMRIGATEWNEGYV